MIPEPRNTHLSWRPQPQPPKLRIYVTDEVPLAVEVLVVKLIKIIVEF